jgi:glycosidase
MRYWFDLGVDGMRLDAIPYLCERDGTNNENLPETHGVLKGDARGARQALPGPVFLAKRTSGRKTSPSTSARATNATWPSISP